MADDPIDHEAAEVGVRTFLIADIRGYTRYTGHFGDEAASELTARFGDICSAAVASHGGRVVETRGDEIMAVFASSRRALRASVELQRSLRAPSDEGRPALVPLVNSRSVVFLSARAGNFHYWATGAVWEQLWVR